MKHSEDLDKFAPAMAKAQSEMGGAVKDSANPFFKSSYADLTSVWKACKEALHNNGFSVIQSPVNEDGRIGVSTMLLHSSGQFVVDKYTLGVKKADDPQADGSSITYARRYALAAFVGVCPVDDDAEGAMHRDSKKPPKKAQEPQLTEYQETMVKGWTETGKGEIDKGKNKADWWLKVGSDIKRDCGIYGAGLVYDALIGGKK